MPHSAQIEQCIETLCESGCEAVRTAIRAMEEGNVPEHAAGLTPLEREAVLQELKAIMAVYDGRK